VAVTVGVLTVTVGVGVLFGQISILSDGTIGEPSSIIPREVSLKLVGGFVRVPAFSRTKRKSRFPPLGILDTFCNPKEQGIAPLAVSYRGLTGIVLLTACHAKTPVPEPPSLVQSVGSKLAPALKYLAVNNIVGSSEVIILHLCNIQAF
jgi:hypothetical protein